MSDGLATIAQAVEFRVGLLQKASFVERAELICDRSGDLPALVRRDLPALVRHCADNLPDVIEGVDHKPGTCRPSCSPECYRAKVRSLAFTLPASFRATR